jgi:hypothetical protein
VIADGTADELEKRVGGERVEVKLTHPAAAAAAQAALADMGDDAPQAEDGIVRVTVRCAYRAIRICCSPSRSSR